MSISFDGPITSGGSNMPYINYISFDGRNEPIIIHEQSDSIQSVTKDDTGKYFINIKAEYAKTKPYFLSLCNAETMYTTVVTGLSNTQLRVLLRDKDNNPMDNQNISVLFF